MAANSLKEQATGLIGSAVLGYLDRDPDGNIPKLLNWWDRLDRDGFHAKQREKIRRIVEDPEGNWYRFTRSFWTDIAPDCGELLETDAGATVTTHCGPNTLGVLFIRK